MGVLLRPRDLNALSPQHTQGMVLQTHESYVLVRKGKREGETTGFTSRKNTTEVVPGAELLCLHLFFSITGWLRGGTAPCLQFHQASLSLKRDEASLDFSRRAVINQKSITFKDLSLQDSSFPKRRFYMI